MSTPATVVIPGQGVPVAAVAFGAKDAPATPVDQTHPLPTQQIVGPSGIPALVGTTTASGTAGPYTPALGRSINLSLSGTWSGTVQLLRSTDGGATKLPITVGGMPWGSYTANANEPVWEESEDGATYYLGITIVSGTLVYRLAQ